MKKFIRLLHSAKKPLAIVLISAFLFMTLASCNWLDELRSKYGVTNNEAAVIRWNDTEFVYVGSINDVSCNLLISDSIFTTQVNTIGADVPILLADMLSYDYANVNITNTLIIYNDSLFVREDLVEKFHDAVLHENCNGAFVLVNDYGPYTVEEDKDNAYIAQIIEEAREKGITAKWSDFRDGYGYVIGRNDSNGFCFDQGHIHAMWNKEPKSLCWWILISADNTVNQEHKYDDDTNIIAYMVDSDDMDRLLELLRILNDLQYGKGIPTPAY